MALKLFRNGRLWALQIAAIPPEVRDDLPLGTIQASALDAGLPRESDRWSYIVNCGLAEKGPNFYVIATEKGLKYLHFLYSEGILKL